MTSIKIHVSFEAPVLPHVDLLCRRKFFSLFVPSAKRGLSKRQRHRESKKSDLWKLERAFWIN